MIDYNLYYVVTILITNSNHIRPWLYSTIIPVVTPICNISLLISSFCTIDYSRTAGSLPGSHKITVFIQQKHYFVQLRGGHGGKIALILQGVTPSTTPKIKKAFCSIISVGEWVIVVVVVCGYVGWANTVAIKC